MKISFFFSGETCPFLSTPGKQWMISQDPGALALSPVPSPLEITGTLSRRDGATGCGGHLASGISVETRETLGTLGSLVIYLQNLELQVGTSEHLQDRNGQMDGSFCTESWIWAFISWI